MTEEIEINVLVSNIIDEKRYSHCRLCLKNTETDNFAKIEDSVDYTGLNEFIGLGDILERLLGSRIASAVPGVDAVCTDCLEKAVNALKFIESCDNSNRRLHNILDNLNSALSVDINTSNQKLFIVCKEDSSQLIFVQEDQSDIDKKVSKLKCSICKEIFHSVDDLNEHTLNAHGLLTCSKCHYTSTNEALMLDHESSSELYECGTCTVVRCTEESLKEHEDSYHGAKVCKVCGKSFRVLNKLLAHEEKHASKNQCPQCGKVYTTREFYQKHVSLCLSGRVLQHPLRSQLDRAYYCPDCGKGYSTAGGLRVHQKFVHGNATPHICQTCGKKFTAPSYLKAHQVTHTGEKNFPCDICKGKFVTREALLYHTRRHTGEKPYTCNLCDEKFVNASSRADHIKHKHIGPTLSCEICPRKFVTKNFLRLHMKKHYDPSNKLYIARSMIPPNVPGHENMRIAKFEDLTEDDDFVMNSHKHNLT